MVALRILFKITVIILLIINIGLKIQFNKKKWQFFVFRKIIKIFIMRQMNVHQVNHIKLYYITSGQNLTWINLSKDLKLCEMYSLNLKIYGVSSPTKAEMIPLGGWMGDERIVCGSSFSKSPSF